MAAGQLVQEAPRRLRRGIAMEQFYINYFEMSSTWFPSVTARSRMCDEFLSISFLYECQKVA